MQLKVGQLANLVCLSVRTLHHYDEIGLLVPSIRTTAGHRLYNTKDIKQLHRIQALKQLGLSLQQIADIIHHNSQPLYEIIAQQIASLEAEINHASQLKTKLQKLLTGLQADEQSDASEWVDALALMNTYEKYLTTDEIEMINSYALTSKYELEYEWPVMVDQLKNYVIQKISPADTEVQNFIILWTEKLESFVGYNPSLLVKVHAMSKNEIEMQIHRGITPEMIEYLGSAMSILHCTIFAKYLSPEQMTLINRNRQKNREEWPSLIAAVHQKIEAGKSPFSDEIRPLAEKWRNLFETCITGGDPEITGRLRLAYENEPLLCQGTGMDPALLRFMRQAMENL